MTTATPAEVKAAVESAIGALKTGQGLTQTSGTLTTDAITMMVAKSRLRIQLDLKFSGTGGGGGKAVLKLTGAQDSFLDVSADASNGDLHGAYYTACDRSIVPQSALLQNVIATTTTQSGLRLYNSPHMVVEAHIKNIHAIMGKVSRGIFITDDVVSVNRSRISPTVENITVVWDATPSAMNDADGLYYENTVGGNRGGLQVVGGTWNNCQKRNIKIRANGSIVTGNQGTNTLTEDMYAFISVYASEIGSVVNNDFDKTGGVQYLLDVGLDEPTPANGYIDKNTLRASGPVMSSSKGIKLGGPAGQIVIGANKFTGVEALFQNYAESATTGQNITMGSTQFDNLSGTTANCIVLAGDFHKATFTDVTAINAVAGQFFLTAANCADSVIEIINARHEYQWGMTNNVRPKTAYDQTTGTLNSQRFENGVLIHTREAAPTSGTHLVGDLTIKLTPVAGGNIGWTCTTAGSPGTWKSYGAIAA